MYLGVYVIHTHTRQLARGSERALGGPLARAPFQQTVSSQTVGIHRAHENTRTGN